MRAAISRASICCQLSSPCRPMITTSSPGLHVTQPGDVHGHHVHRHCADDGRATAADEHRAAARQARIETVGVAGGHDGNRPRRVGRELPAVADALARPQALHGHHAAGQRHRRRERQGRRQRRRHDAVEQQARPHRVVPHARVAQRGRAVGRVTDPRPPAQPRQVASAASKRVRCSSKSGLSGTSALAKCVETPSSWRCGLASTAGSVRSRLSCRNPSRCMPVSIFKW